MTFKELLVRRWEAAQEFERAGNVIRELQDASIIPSTADYARLTTARQDFDNIDRMWNYWRGDRGYR